MDQSKNVLDIGTSQGSWSAKCDLGHWTSNFINLCQHAPCSSGISFFCLKSHIRWKLWLLHNYGRCFKIVPPRQTFMFITFDEFDEFDGTTVPLLRTQLISRPQFSANPADVHLVRWATSWQWITMDIKQCHRVKSMHEIKQKTLSESRNFKSNKFSR